MLCSPARCPIEREIATHPDPTHESPSHIKATAIENTHTLPQTANGVTMKPRTFFATEVPSNSLGIKYHINRRFFVGRLEITVELRKGQKHNPWGRFGGGWNWELGFQASSRTVIINWLIGSTRIYWPRRKDSK